MEKRIKMRISLILVILVLFQGLTVLAAETNNIIEFDLKTAIDTAIKNSNSLKLSDEKIKNATDIYYHYYNLSVSASTKPSYTDYDLIENKKEELIYPKQKLNELNNLKYDKQNKIIDIKLDVTEKYFTLLSVDKQIANQQSLIVRLKADLKIKMSNVNIGKGTASSVTDVQLSIKRAMNKMVQLNRDKEKAAMSLNSLLGRPINEQLKIKEIKIPKITYSEIDIDAIIADRQQNNYTIKDIKFTLDQAKLEAEIVKDNTNREDPIELEALEDTQLNQEYALKDELVNIEKYIRQENNTILNLKDEIEIKSLSNEICQKNLKVAQEKLKLGVLSQSEINSVINAAEQANIEYLQAQLNYYLEVERFNAYIEKQ